MGSGARVSARRAVAVAFQHEAVATCLTGATTITTGSCALPLFSSPFSTHKRFLLLCACIAAHLFPDSPSSVRAKALCPVWPPHCLRCVQRCSLCQARDRSNRKHQQCNAPPYQARETRMLVRSVYVHDQYVMIACVRVVVIHREMAKLRS